MPKSALPTIRYIVFYQIFLPIVVALRPKLPWRLLAFLVIFCVNLTVVAFTMGDIDTDYMSGAAWGAFIATSLHLLLLSDPINDFHHGNDSVHPKDMPFFRRAYWALCLQNAIRGIGWNYKLPHTPPSPNEPRWSFVRFQCINALRYVLAIDAAQLYTRQTRLSSKYPSGDGASLATVQGYFYISARVYWMMQLQYTVLSIVYVALGFCEAKDFPPLFGRWRDAYTVRRFWGRSWHQLMRRFVSSIGKSIARGMGFQPGTNMSSYTQLYVGFIVSGLLHVIGDVTVSMKYFGLSFPFFLVQAIAITMEDAVIALAGRAGIDKTTYLTRTIGYAWVILWFSVSLAWYLDWQIAAGIQLADALPISPITFATRLLNKRFNVVF